MLRWLSALVCLTGCDVVFDLTRAPYPTESDLDAFRIDLARDATPDVVVLDRRTTPARVHFLESGVAPTFGDHPVTIPLGFTPLTVATVLLYSDSELSMLVGGVRDASGVIALVRQRSHGVFDAPVELGVPNGTGAITSLEVIERDIDTGHVTELAWIAGGRAGTTIHLDLVDPSFEVRELAKGLGPAARVHWTDDTLWVADDTGAYAFTIDGTTGALVPGAAPTWDATPARLRVTSSDGDFGVGHRLHAFSARCRASACTLRWDAPSQIEAAASAELALEQSVVTHLVISEVAGGNTVSDVTVFGLQADGDEVVSLYPDLDFDGTTFHWMRDGAARRFVHGCLGGLPVAAFTTTNLSSSARESLVMIDTGGTGYAMDDAGACQEISLGLAP